MSITETPHGTVVPFQKPSPVIQPVPGITQEAGAQALADQAFAALSVCDDAHTEAYLAASTLRAVSSSKHHGAERMWMFDQVVEKVAAMKARAGQVPRPPSFRRDAIWFDALFKPIEATVTLLTETIDRDVDRTLRINLAAKLEALLYEVDQLLHRIAAGWEHQAKAAGGGAQ
jgi:hypothetical protein